MGDHVCGWAAKNPDKSDGRTDCHGWSCRTDPTRCDRKKGHQTRRRAEASSYRKFPGSAAERDRKRAGRRVEVGTCKWCDQEILRADGHARDNRRTWHSGKGSEPDCLLEFFRHTRQPEQLTALVERDGPGCACCGKAVGHWAFPRLWIKDDWIGRYQDDAAQEEEGPDGLMCRAWWTSWLEVDHVIALALVVLEIAPDDQWRFWGPENLQGLCGDCHKAKTVQDVRKIKAARALADVPEAI